jgi:hypothetical protein
VVVLIRRLPNVFPDRTGRIVMPIPSPFSVGNWTIGILFFLISDKLMFMLISLSLLILTLLGVTAASHTFGVSQPPLYYITGTSRSMRINCFS